CTGGQRRQVPCGCVVPDWEERLQIGRRRYVISLYHAITPQTPSKLVVVSQIFAAHFQFVPSERGREVIPNGLRVLQDVQGAGSNRVPAQHDNDGTSVQPGVIWKILALPSDCRLVLPLVICNPSLELVHRPVAQDVR